MPSSTYDFNENGTSIVEFVSLARSVFDKIRPDDRDPQTFYFVVESDGSSRIYHGNTLVSDFIKLDHLPTSTERFPRSRVLIGYDGSNYIPYYSDEDGIARPLKVAGTTTGGGNSDSGTASQISVKDAGNYFNSETVEDALQEVGGSIKSLSDDKQDKITIDGILKMSEGRPTSAVPGQDYLTPENISGLYTLPDGGIPKTDLSKNVVESLDKADNSQSQSIDDEEGYFDTDTVEGALRELGYKSSKVDYVFENVQSLKDNSNRLKSGDYCRTEGYYSSGDGGKASYLITSEAPKYTEGTISIGSGKYALLLSEGSVNILQFGAKNTIDHSESFNKGRDDSRFIQEAIEYCYNSLRPDAYTSNLWYPLCKVFIVPPGFYYIRNQITYPPYLTMKTIGNPVFYSFVHDRCWNPDTNQWESPKNRISDPYDYEKPLYRMVKRVDSRSTASTYKEITDDQGVIQSQIVTPEEAYGIGVYPQTSYITRRCYRNLDNVEDTKYYPVTLEMIENDGIHLSDGSVISNYDLREVWSSDDESFTDYTKIQSLSSNWRPYAMFPVEVREVEGTSKVDLTTRYTYEEDSTSLTDDRIDKESSKFTQIVYRKLREDFWFIPDKYYDQYSPISQLKGYSKDLYYPYRKSVIKIAERYTPCRVKLLTNSLEVINEDDVKEIIGRSDETYLILAGSPKVYIEVSGSGTSVNINGVSKTNCEIKVSSDGICSLVVKEESLPLDDRTELLKGTYRMTPAYKYTDASDNNTYLIPKRLYIDSHLPGSDQSRNHCGHCLEGVGGQLVIVNKIKTTDDIYTDGPYQSTSDDPAQKSWNLELPYPTTCGIELGTIEEILGDLDQKSSYDWIKMKDVVLKYFGAGLLARGTNYYGSVISNFSFSWCLIGHLYGESPCQSESNVKSQRVTYRRINEDCKLAGGVSSIKQDGSWISAYVPGGETEYLCASYASSVGISPTGEGELMHFRDCLFNTNVIDFLANIIGTFSLEDCHMDYSNCNFVSKSRVRFYMNNSHIEGTGSHLFNYYFSDPCGKKGKTPQEVMDTFLRRKDCRWYHKYYGMFYQDNPSSESGESLVDEQNNFFYFYNSDWRDYYKNPVPMIYASRTYLKAFDGADKALWAAPYSHPCSQIVFRDTDQGVVPDIPISYLTTIDTLDKIPKLGLSGYTESGVASLKNNIISGFMFSETPTPDLSKEVADSKGRLTKILDHKIYGNQKIDFNNNRSHGISTPRIDLGKDMVRFISNRTQLLRTRYFPLGASNISPKDGYSFEFIEGNNFSVYNPKEGASEIIVAPGQEFLVNESVAVNLGDTLRIGLVTNQLAYTSSKNIYSFEIEVREYTQSDPSLEDIHESVSSYTISHEVSDKFSDAYSMTTDPSDSYHSLSKFYPGTTVVEHTIRTNGVRSLRIYIKFPEGTLNGVYTPDNPLTLAAVLCESVSPKW